MADEGVQVQSLQARIAALNLGHVGRSPSAPDITTAIPEVEQRPQVGQRGNSTTVPPTRSVKPTGPNGMSTEPNGTKRNGVLPPPTIMRTGQGARPAKPVAPPRLPPRTPSSQSSPALPPRRPSALMARRGSSESIASSVSNISTISNLSSGTARTSISRSPPSMETGRQMAPAFDPSNPPPLLPKRPARTVEHEKTPANAQTSKPSAATVKDPPASKVPSVPPRLPARKEPSRVERAPVPEQPPTMPARPRPSFEMNKARELSGVNGGPPPVPLASRPDLSSREINKTGPPTMASAPSCLSCRDFSGPDTHAAKFPRESVPSLDWLARQLATPFPSSTDKARAIFTWLHHNIAYDVVSFFNRNVQPSTPASTLSTGLAVCEGYAGLFTALASKVGLESVVVRGHGKGYSFAPLPPGASIPSEHSNHAWNAVMIDNGEWKLIDCCWGAGNISGEGKPYNKSFTPVHFTMPNEEFGLRHFPTDSRYFFRKDGRQITWEEYILGDRGGELARVYSGVASTEGLAPTKFLPRYLHVPVAPSQHPGPTVRFQFERVCEHWDPVRHGAGKPYVFILSIHGVDGQNDDYIPCQTNGIIWWADVPLQSLGVPGQTVNLYIVDTLDGANARGLTLDEYRAAIRRKPMTFNGVAAWELV